MSLPRWRDQPAEPQWRRSIAWRKMNERRWFYEHPNTQL
jgi:hypothetical protein